MIVRLDIQKIAPGVYAFHCSDALESPTTHDSLSEGISFYGTDIPPEIGEFVNITYGGCQLETTPVNELVNKAEVLAQRLVALMAALHEAGRQRGEYCA